MRTPFGRLVHSLRRPLQCPFSHSLCRSTNVSFSQSPAFCVVATNLRLLCLQFDTSSANDDDVVCDINKVVCTSMFKPTSPASVIEFDTVGRRALQVNDSLLFNIITSTSTFAATNNRQQQPAVSGKKISIFFRRTRLTCTPFVS